VPTRIDVLIDTAELQAQLAGDVREGLARSPKAVRSRWIWDARGSELFERICELPSYELPRRESSILAARASEIAALTRPKTVVELGSGSASKTTLLLDALAPAGLDRFVAVDVSEAALRASLPRLAARYPSLDLRGVVADFERQLALVEAPGRKLVVLLGSTIGALEPPERALLLAEVAGFLGSGGVLLLGVDLVKPVAQVLAAYAHPDELSGGLIANLLPVVNRELRADFEPARFRAESSWNPDAERLETVVRSLEHQVVTIRELDLTVELSPGETIRTQVSTKFRREGLEAEFCAAGLRLVAWWPDEEGAYAVCLARPNHRPD
jgi:L-histidine Nalpha-methyltransferase